MEHRSAFGPLQGHRYVSLTTFRKTGKPVSTPVWFAGDERKIYVWTNAGSGKVKRLRNSGEVKLAPCTYNGRVLGPDLSGRADFLEDSPAEEEVAQRSLRAKYGWQWRLGRFLSRTFGRHSLFLRITPS